jgi:hypothetical protein
MIKIPFEITPDTNLITIIADVSGYEVRLALDTVHQTPLLTLPHS